MVVPEGEEQMGKKEWQELLMREVKEKAEDMINLDGDDDVRRSRTVLYGDTEYSVSWCDSRPERILLSERNSDAFRFMRVLLNGESLRKAGKMNPKEFIEDIFGKGAGGEVVVENYGFATGQFRYHAIRTSVVVTDERISSSGYWGASGKDTKRYTGKDREDLSRWLIGKVFTCPMTSHSTFGAVNNLLEEHEGDLHCFSAYIRQTRPGRSTGMER